jgi:polyphosphate kinase
MGKDLTELFNYLTTGYTPKRNYRKILPSPKMLKRALLNKIDREIEAHVKGNDGLIQFKINALYDAELCRALYKASEAGVHIDLIIRDTCQLRPGLTGISDNINVISVVSQFLEHNRIYYFHNGGDDEYYLGSADAMKRNLEHRVEVVVPVENPVLQSELRTTLDTYITDQRSAWDMNPDGSYVQRQPADETILGSQQILIQKAEDRQKEALRLKKRKPQVIGRRNVKRDNV